jgi:hypothetical protein
LKQCSVFYLRYCVLRYFVNMAPLQLLTASQPDSPNRKIENSSCTWKEKTSNNTCPVTIQKK